LTVAAVQFRSTYRVSENLARLRNHLEQLAARGVNVAVFPECALTGYDKDRIRAESFEVPAAEEEIRQTCHAHNIGAIVGSIHQANGRTYNTAVVIDAKGELLERYAKIYLAGEKWATPGNHVAYFELGGVASTVMICHDERYPELPRLPALQGARVLYYVSHEYPLTDEAKLRPGRAQMMARAVENGIFVVAANAPANLDLSGSHGQSRIIGYDGNVLKEASIFAEETLVETLEVKPGKLKRPLEGPLGEWWRQGVEWMMQNRHRPLD
jgi:predicted amidohydrolase